MMLIEDGIKSRLRARATGSGAGSSAGADGIKQGQKTGISFREAALHLRVSEKTLRARIRRGEVQAWTVAGKRGLEWRVRLPEGWTSCGGDRGQAQGHGSEVQDYDRKRYTEDPGRARVHAGEAQAHGRDQWVLRVRLDGAQLAAKLHAQRHREARREAQEAKAEVEFLRVQLQSRTDAERELRLLMAQSTTALRLLTERPALAAATPPPGRSRWWPWRRGD